MAGVGVVAVGVGVYFGVDTSSKWKDAKTHCNASYECDQTGVDLTNQAKSSGTISTIAVVAGTALVICGAVLFFTAPKQTQVGVGPGTVHLRGTF